jgi:hypothetical protein
MDSLAENSSQLRATAPLLISESQDEFASLCRELEQDIQPHGVIERTYLDDIACIVWEIQRLRRYKAVIIDNCRFTALQRILEQLLDRRYYANLYDKDRDAEELARSWFASTAAQARVAKLLRKFQMDESAIEAQAFRLCADDLERLDRMLTLAEARRDKALRCLAEYRQIFAKQVRESTDRILDNEDVPRLVSVVSRAAE